MNKLRHFFVLPFFIFTPAFAGKLINPEFARPVSTWKSFNKKIYKLCKVNHSKNKPKESTKTIKIFFDNNIHNLGELESQKIITAFQNHLLPNVTQIKIFAHADVKGDDDYNLRLSWQRLMAVTNFINENRLIKKPVKITTGYFGEKQSTAHQKKDRLVEIKFIQTKPTTTDINQIYLIDGSLSMKNGITKDGYTFNDISRLEIPKDTIAFVVRDNLAGCSGEHLSNYTPQGRTYIREAIGLIAYNISEKIQVTIFTDGIEPLSHREEIIIERHVQGSINNHGAEYFIK